MRKIFGLSVLILICVISNVLALEETIEGGPCLNFDGTPGVCRIDRMCKWALDKLKSKEIKVSQLVRCGLIGTSSVICCKEDVVLAATTKRPQPCVNDFAFDCPPPSVKPVDPAKAMDTRKSERACELIKQKNINGLDFHIIGGEGADPGEFPHMAALGYSDEVDEGKFSFDCGGSLIAQDFVLTAGHCVNRRDRQPKVIKIGRVSLEEDDKDTSEAQQISVKKVHLHPKYTARKKYNDIALLELMETVKYEKNARPACLYTSKRSLPPTQILEITGWGVTNTDTRQKSTWLQKASLTELPLDECRKIYEKVNLGNALSDSLIPSQICATAVDKDGKVLDACQGDSGGPIQIRTRVRQDDIFHIVGVTSFGAACGSDIPGVYTRVAEYLDWIEPVVWPGNVVI